MNTNPLWLVIASLVITLLPMIIGAMTSYVKVTVVVGMVKNALGVQHTPGIIAEMALSLAITCFVMSPILHETGEILEKVRLPDLTRMPSITVLKELAPAAEPIRKFLEHHSGERELSMLREIAGESTEKDLSLRFLIPGFLLTELKAAFAMGVTVLLPFLAVDLIVANLLTGMGMMMVSPTVIALPLKLLLFVLADGWVLVTRGLILSYQG